MGRVRGHQAKLRNLILSSRSSRAIAWRNLHNRAERRTTPSSSSSSSGPPFIASAPGTGQTDADGPACENHFRLRTSQKHVCPRGINRVMSRSHEPSPQGHGSMSSQSTSGRLIWHARRLVRTTAARTNKALQSKQSLLQLPFYRRVLWNIQVVIG